MALLTSMPVDLRMKEREELRKIQFPSDVPLKIPILPPTFLECKLENDLDVVNIATTKNTNAGNQIVQNQMPFPFSADPTLRFAAIETTQVLTTGKDVKKVLNLSLNMDENKLNCLPGDTVGIVPQNVAEEVEELLTCLDLLQHAEDVYSIQVLNGTKKKNVALPLYLPSVFILRDVLKTCVDIRTVPKKAFLRVLCEYTSEDSERRRLKELCSQQGGESYTKLILNKGLCLLDILKTFPSCVPPVERLLEHLPRLQARPYSIVLQEENRIHIAITVVENGVGGRRGLCSGWLNDIALEKIDGGELHHRMQRMTVEAHAQSVKIPIYLRCSTSFRVPEDPSVPLIMVGPGTGVAPFLGFLQYRSAQKKVDCQIQLGYSWLFFGCRYADRDYLYRTEIKEFVSQGILNKLSVSFSREEDKLEPNIKYVQDNIKKEKEQFVSQLLKNNNVTFLCGDAKHMAKDVRETIIQCIQEVKGITQNEAKEVFFNLEKENRYLQDVWL